MTKQSCCFSPDTSDNTMRSPLYLFLLVICLDNSGIVTSNWGKTQKVKNGGVKHKACGAWHDLTFKSSRKQGQYLQAWLTKI